LTKRCISLTLAICAAASWGAVAQERKDLPLAARAERPYVKESLLASRDFPLFSLILEDAPIRELVAHDAVLKTATTERWKAIAEANRTCDGEVACKSKSLQFTPQQIDEVSAALRRLYETNSFLRDFAHAKLKPVAVFSLDTSQAEESVFIENWIRSANDMNRIIATYCNGTAPRYPEIDSMTYVANSKSYAALITILLDDLAVEKTPSNTPPYPASDALFFEPTLRFSVRLLESNSRDEAGRFWPLETGENFDAVKQIGSIRWAQFPYSVILVPGAGSEVPNVSVSPWGRERVRLSVLAYRSGRAPFILVSGGFVHPSKTQYCEAIEMKRYLMEVYGVPATAILLDPYARHTTTNLRNASREVFDYGIPSDKPMLIVSDDAQITYIQSATFLERTRNELGYLPVKLGKRLSSSELEAIPSFESLYVDAGDPLDP
jgi:hypothetical protein